MQNRITSLTGQVDRLASTVLLHRRDLQARALEATPEDWAAYEDAARRLSAASRALLEAVQAARP